MASFTCQHGSISLCSILLVSAVILLSAPVGLCGCYKRIFSFGDSIIDTGNFAFSTGKGPSAIKEPPYGMTFFNRPTGRVSDGRVLVDFFAEALGLPLIPPNLPEKDTGLFPNGANFAVFASTAMPPDYFRKWNHSTRTPGCLGQQMGWFKEMLQRIAPSDADKKQILGESLIVLGEIGGNDYNFWFGARRPREEAAQFIPDIVGLIGSTAQELIGLGAKAIMIPNNFPIGCVPSYLAGFEGSAGDYDEHQCLRWFNDFSQRHNQALRAEVDRLGAQNPGVKLVYADYFGAAMELVRNPSGYGIGDPLVACCGGDGRYHTGSGCNRTAKLWGNPAGFASWDGMHMTEKAYDVISKGVLTGPYASLPSPLTSC